MVKEPLWRMIANDLRDQIESGELEPGSQVPNENELRAIYDNTSRNTIREATKWLSSRGLVSSEPGRGTFVVKQVARFIIPLTPDAEGMGGGEGDAFMDTVIKQRGTPSASNPRVEIQKATEDVATALKIEVGARVISRHQERSIDDQPNSLQTSYYPWAFIESGASALLTAEDVEGGTTQYLRNECGIHQAGYRDRLLVRQPNKGEVDYFAIPDDGTVSVIATHRTTYDTNGEPIRYAETVYAYNRNLFVIDYGTVPPLSLEKPE